MSEEVVRGSHKLRFDGTVHFGHLLIIISFITSASIAYSTLRSDINNHDWRIQNIESAVRDQGRVNGSLQETLSSIGKDIAVIRTKVDRIESTAK